VSQARFVADTTADVVLVAFLASLAFVVVYSLMAPWWRSPIGRALIMLDASLALTLAPSVLHHLTGISIIASTGFAWYYLVTLTMVAASTIWRTWIIYRAQRPAAAPVTDETARAAPGSG
jgi:hypothetical protein